MITGNVLDTLRDHASRLGGARVSGLLAAEPNRAQELALRVGPLYVNFARQGFDRQALEALLRLARECDVAGGLRRLFAGERINSTEDRAVLHTALRGNLVPTPEASEAHAQALAVQQHMAGLVAALHASDVTDVVSVGIGGSDLGPRLVADALRPVGAARIRVHFVSNVDGAAMQRLLAGLDPAA